VPFEVAGGIAADFRRGVSLKLTATLLSGEPVTAPISLLGFSAALADLTRRQLP
jgi:invasion protein IalB